MSNSEELISSLSSDLKKVDAMPHPLKRAITILLIAATYMAVAVFALGMRSDIEVKIHDNIFVFEMAYIFITALSAAICSSWLCVPDVRGAKWILATPIVLLSFGVMWSFIHFDIDIHKITHIEMHHCHIKSIIFGTVPIFAILFFSVKGRTTHPYMMALMNIIFVGTLGYIALRVACSSDNAEHICYIHVMPYLLLGIAMAALGKHIYRW